MMKRKPGAKLPQEVFLSHASKDRRIASGIAAMLREHGVPVWYSETNLLGAQQWHDEIGAALARCDWFLVLLSPQAIRSKWVKRELLYALRASRYDGRIVPIRYRVCAPSYELGDLDSRHPHSLKKPVPPENRQLRKLPLLEFEN